MLPRSRKRVNGPATVGRIRRRVGDAGPREWAVSEENVEIAKRALDPISLSGMRSSSRTSAACAGETAATPPHKAQSSSRSGNGRIASVCLYQAQDDALKAVGLEE
jgi:hypothetical protein